MISIPSAFRNSSIESRLVGATPEAIAHFGSETTRSSTHGV